MNLEKIKSEAFKRGMDAEKMVQNKLWKYGYNVERIPFSPKGQPYDLVVDNNFRVEVLNPGCRG